jgi:hypothetical protein
MRAKPSDLIDKCLLPDVSYFCPAHWRPRGEEQGARRKPCRVVFIVAPVERHLREFDRRADDLKVIERDLARSALADDAVKR